MEDKLHMLADVLAEYGLTKVSFEEGDVKICLEKDLPKTNVSYVNQAPTNIEQSFAQPAQVPAAPTGDEVLSPLAGIYYGRANPEAQNFVREGSRVKAGDTLCIIESMKIMNEIKAPYDLTVIKVMKKDEQVAEYNETLFVVKQ
ncbi:MAG: biotin/lipoyl-containing protein [Clostridiaceae bacterium]